MVKKHHAWKVTEPGGYLYGECFYGVHSIEYESAPETGTFHAFALRDAKGDFAAFAEVEAYAEQREIPVVPVLFRVALGHLPRFTGSWNVPTVNPRRLEVRGRASYYAWREAFRGRSFNGTCARAFGLGTCGPTNIGPGTGGRAGSYGAPDEAVCRSGEGVSYLLCPSSVDFTYSQQGSSLVICHTRRVSSQCRSAATSTSSATTLLRHSLGR